MSMAPTREMILMRMSRTRLNVLAVLNPWNRSRCDQRWLSTEQMGLVPALFFQYLNLFLHRNRLWFSLRRERRRLLISRYRLPVIINRKEGGEWNITWDYEVIVIESCEYRICIYFLNRIYLIRIVYGGVVLWHISEPMTSSVRMSSTLLLIWFR